MLSLIYTSKATTIVTAERVQRLSETSARNNRQLGVTGLLLYGSGHYFQVMEGEAEHVGRLFDRIQKDHRHEGCQVLHRQVTRKRCFSGWKTGMLNEHDTCENEQAHEWEIIAKMLQIMPGSGVLNDPDDVLDCVREFIDCHTGVTAVC